MFCIAFRSLAIWKVYTIKNTEKDPYSALLKQTHIKDDSQHPDKIENTEESFLAMSAVLHMSKFLFGQTLRP